MKHILFFLFISLWINCSEDNSQFPKFSIAVDPSHINVPFEGGKYIITVSSSIDWQVKNDSAWCHVSLESGTFRQSQITIVVDDNLSKIDRENVITVAIESQTCTITILQEGLRAYGQGTESDPYLIYTPQELNALADSVMADVTSQKYYRLARDIVYTDSTCRIIGSAESPFYGSFDGNGYLVSNFYVCDSLRNYVGLFGYVDSCAVVKGVNLQGYVHGGDYSGGVVGYSRGVVYDCHYKGRILGENYVGGVCGYNDSLLTDCSHIGYVKGNSYVGGIVGNNMRTLDRCTSQDTVYGKLYCGGICAQNYDSLANCSHQGFVYGSSNLGGVCGYNMGYIFSSNHSGGISTSCIEPDYTAGVCGKNSGHLVQCYNEGTVKCYWPAGVCSDNSGVIDQCYNKGQIDGHQLSGGVCALNDQFGMIVNCYNVGNIVADGNFCGGICGQNSRDAVIANSYNTGNVTTKGYRIGGLSGINNGLIQNCYNTGTVTTTDTYYGSLYGYNSNTGEVLSCYYLDSTETHGDPQNEGIIKSCEAFSNTGALIGGIRLFEKLNTFVADHDEYCDWDNSSFPLLIWK